MKRTVARIICNVKKTAGNLSTQTTEFVSEVGNKISKFELEGELSILYEELGKLYMSSGSDTPEFASLVKKIQEKEDLLKVATEKDNSVCLDKDCNDEENNTPEE